MKHTPAPWKIINDSQAFVCSTNDKGAMHFWASIRSEGTYCAGDEELRANIELIAAAPDLLQAAIATYSDQIDQGVTEEELRYLSDAIAKATGEEQWKK